jgi:putative lipoprotein
MLKFRRVAANVLIFIASTAALALILHTSARADDWNGPDKKQHFAISFVLGIASASAFPDRPALAVGLAMTPGLIKELSDAQKGGSGFSGKDLAWDLAGAALGVAGTRWMIKRNGISYRTEF